MLRLLGPAPLAAALVCAIWVTPVRADWSDVEVTASPGVRIAQDDSDAQSAPARSQDWTPVAQAEAPSRQYMQSTVGPSPADSHRVDNEDDLPPHRPQPASSKPAHLEPGSPGLAASKLVLKNSAAAAPKASEPQQKPTAQQPAPEIAEQKTPEAVEPTSVAPISGPARQYCINVADAAADARFAWKAKTLAEIEMELDKRIATLEQRTAEFQMWLARRDEFSNRAVKQLVNIYRRMAPDSAAAQLVAMEPETAAAVLSKVDARVASAILNEMQPTQAARLTTIIAGSARTSTGASAAKTASERSTAQSEQAPSDAGKL